MSTLSVILTQATEAYGEQLINSLLQHSAVNEIIQTGQAESSTSHKKFQVIATDSYSSGQTVQKAIDAAKGDYLLWLLPGNNITLGARAIERLLQVAEDSGAAWLYSDFREANTQGEISDHPLIDYQFGAIRDNFDFGSLMLVSRVATVNAIKRHGAISADLKWGGLYDLRLKLSIDSAILRLPEPIYTRAALDTRLSGEKIFDYVDPRKRDYQVEMERVATEHLKRINAWLEPQFSTVPESTESFPVKATVVIPVRNREKTVADAVRSVLSQQTDFNFNLIVVDNHSTDATTEILRKLAAEDSRLIHLIPERTDYGIGGCWNEALYSSHCGRYIVQLDSDDIYTDEHTLAKIIAKFDEGKYAMVIGSYTIVDFDLNELPPGLIDHREWTRENG
ncbi:MAG TPA: glycosyltransferase family 2 protein, partial [Blastocatellia bacterium]|nr:glycosyltransferase family 2 protein [Blastocatellia bacterium]